MPPSPSPSPSPSTPLPPTGIHVIIIGAGFGGLTAAIECHRQGHKVSVYESFPKLLPLGDIISFGPNAGRIFYRWGTDHSITRTLRSLSIDLASYGFNIHKWTGELICNQPSPPPREETPVFNGHRGELHEVIWKYLTEELGVQVNLGRKVVAYSESDNGASIELADGEKVQGDVVIACDGVRSKARELVLGYEDKPKSSGYAIFRAWFTNEKMMADPETRRFCEDGDAFNGWIGPDVHFLFSTIKGGKDCCWVLTHKDEADVEESWNLPGKLEDVYKVFEGWDPLCKRIVEKTPEDKLVDWKLVYRDPLPTWVSKKGRIVLAGDSAHPFLPTSAQGATQSMEDGVTLAVCLKRAGKTSVPDATRAYEAMRYERVKAVQKTGETTRDMWHKADWDKVKEDPKSVQMPREDWIFEHDAELHAEEVFDKVLAEVRGKVSKSNGVNEVNGHVEANGLVSASEHLQKTPVVDAIRV